MPDQAGSEKDMPAENGSLIVYGTLRDAVLRNVILGQTDHLRLSEMMLEDYRVSQVQGESFPIIEAAKGQVAKALRIDGLSPNDRARLDFYESGFAYDVVQIDGADIYMPPRGQWQAGGAWSLSQWQNDFGAVSRMAAAEVMSYFGQLSGVDVAARFGMIRARAASRLRADAEMGPVDGRLSRDDVALFGQRMPYFNFFAMGEADLSFKRFDGSSSPVVTRAAFKSADAAIVLPYDPVRDRVLLVEQFRVGPYLRGASDCWSMEPIAGLIDAFETPQDAAHREAMEEAGLKFSALHTVAEAYPSPGSSTEFFYLYVGTADLPDDITGVGGEVGEAEDIASHLLSFDAFMKVADGGGLKNAPTLLLALWLARHRDELRAGIARAGS
ncbi:NUDIX domain-containing protein [Nereida sp.]|uniref:NUDIX domain-containing protein n=1 Tax=Nereida sp. TaxID=2736090 RepID=UPI003F69CCB2